MSNKNKVVFLLPILIIFGFFFIFPLVVLFITSIKGETELTFSNYTSLITNPYYFKAVINSIWLSAAVTIVALIISGVLAFFLARSNFRGKSLYFTFLTFPISFPGVVVGFMIIILFGSTGIVPMLTQMITGEKMLDVAYTIAGIFLAYLYFEIPRIIMTLYGAIRGINMSLEEAARTLGASSWQAIQRVVLPAVFPIFISAGALAFSTSMGAFGTVFTLANEFEILPILMYSEFTLNFNIEVASAMALVIGVICVLFNFGARIILERGESR